MGRLPRMFFLTVGTFALTACLSTKRASPQLSETKANEEANHFSIGLLLVRNAGASSPVGHGTIIAETTEQYVGLTSLAALESCLPTESSENRCWIRFNDDQGKPKFAQVHQYSGEAKFPVAWEEFSDGQPVALAMFGINKRRAAHLLKPVELNTVAWPQGPIPTKVTAYTGTDNGQDAVLNDQIATAWISKGELIHTSAHIGMQSEGAPLFVYVPSQTDMRMVWRLAGVVGLNKDDPLFLARSAANLSVMRKKYPELAVWRRMHWDEKGIPSSSGALNVKALEIEKTADQELFKITLQQSDFKERAFSVLGFSLENQDDLNVSIHQDVVTISFEAEKALREKREKLGWIYFEYFDADEKPIFAACTPKNIQDTKDYECGQMPPG